MNTNNHYDNLQDSYLFARVGQKVKEYKAQNPGAQVISLGIGDVTQPLAPAVIDALHSAVSEMGYAESFRGYGEYQGCDFLQEAICGYYASKNVMLQPDEVFISDGAKSDLGNILDIFASDNTVWIPDPVYPVYVDTNIMAGRPILFMDGNAGNGFLPLPDNSTHADIIYLCSPNNPTGAAYTSEQLRQWVDYAQRHDAVILFDSAYEAFVQDDSLPTSIFQIDGARECAIEFCSLSKTAGFTGTRCGYTVIPRALVRGGKSLNKLWLRRQTTKFNGVPYIIQRGAAAVFTPEGQQQVRTQIAYYMQNAKTLSDTLAALGIWYTGGLNSPYIWLKCPNDMPSWDFFDALLNQASIVGTPGEGFGKNGAGYFRLTAFGSRENTLTAAERLRTFIKNTL